MNLEKVEEMQKEELKLKKVIEDINKEIINYVNKRKNITDAIVQSRKNVIEEYKDDEDKIIEYFDHEKYLIEEAFKIVDKRLKELNILSTNPYFGKVVFEEEDFGKEEIYIGRFGLTKEGEFEPSIIDWRAPVAALFYAGKLGEAQYVSPDGVVNVDIESRRQFVIKKTKLKGMFDSAIDVKDEILQMVLSNNAGDKLKDIVMTIQQEQDEIIRQPRNKTIVVNGAAGSGKTTIALHRVAYLLYNYRDQLKDKVLILGPNNVFNEYISSVLPSLGETGVKQTTFNDFAAELLGMKEDIDIFQCMERILKDDEKIKKEISYKSSQSYVNDLDNYIDSLDKSLYKIGDVNFYEKTVVSKEEILEMMQNHFKSMPLYKRVKKIKRIVFTKIKEERNLKVQEIKKKYKLMSEELTKDERILQENNLIFNEKIEIRNTIKNSMELKKSLTWLDSPEVINVYNNFNNNKALVPQDLSGLLYLKCKLEGFKLSEEIKHIVIDEAQDYSYLQFKVLKQITKCQSMTIVGDVNQRLIPCENDNIAMVNLESCVSDIDIEYFPLRKSYRSTKEIIDYANKYLEGNPIIPIVRTGKEVVEEEISDRNLFLERLTVDISNAKENGYESIAVICRGLEETKKIGKMLKEKTYINVIDREDLIYNSGNIVIPSYLAKGLEFDVVIVIDSCTDSEEKFKYVMATRALHELYVYDIKKLI